MKTLVSPTLVLCAILFSSPAVGSEPEGIVVMSDTVELGAPFDNSDGSRLYVLRFPLRSGLEHSTVPDSLFVDSVDAKISSAHGGDFGVGVSVFRGSFSYNRSPCIFLGDSIAANETMAKSFNVDTVLTEDTLVYHLNDLDAVTNIDTIVAVFSIYMDRVQYALDRQRVQFELRCIIPPRKPTTVILGHSQVRGELTKALSAGYSGHSMGTRRDLLGRLLPADCRWPNHRKLLSQKGEAAPVRFRLTR